MRFSIYLFFLLSLVFTLPVQRRGLSDSPTDFVERSNEIGEIQSFEDFIQLFTVDDSFNGLLNKIATDPDEEAVNDLFKRLVENLPVNEQSNNGIAKRENKALTQLMTNLNTSGTGVAFIKYFATDPLVQPVTINAVVGFLKSKPIDKLLTALDTSNLAVDIVNEVLSHIDAFNGLVSIVKTLFVNGIVSFKKRDLVSDPLQVKRSLLGDIIGGVGDIIGGVGGLLFGNGGNKGNTAPSTSSSTNPSPTSVVGGASGTSTSIIGGVGGQATLVTGSFAGQATSVIGSVGGQVTSVTGGFAGQATSVVGGVNGKATSIVSSFAGQATSASTNAMNVPKTTSTTKPQTSSAFGGGLFGLLGGLVGTVVNTVGGIVQNVGGTLVNATDSAVGGVISITSDVLGAGATIVNGLTGLNLPVGLDATQVAIFQALLSFSSTADLQDFMVALDKSGLGSSVIHEALTDPNMQKFVINLAVAIQKNNVWTLSSVVNAALSTGFLTNTIAKLFSTPQYSNTLLGFIQYILFNFYRYL